jgi:glycosyltransferase involved in cell wall biosynthesis
MNPKVTLGLCVKNGSNIVETAFNSILIQNYPHESLKLVIVDNDSKDDTLLIALEFAKRIDIPTLIVSFKGGLGAARQVVVNNAEGDYLLWVDDDLVLREDYVKNQVAFMEKNPNLGGVKGFYDQATCNYDVYSIAILPDIFPVKFSNLKTIGAGGSIYRLKALKEIGGFDVNINGAAEDVDVSLRLRSNGWLLGLNPSAIVYQKYPPKTPKTFWKRYLGYGYGNHFLFHKFKDKSILIQYFPFFAFLVGVKTSIIIYRQVCTKKAMFFWIIYPAIMGIQGLGFIKAHLNKYGHL